MKRILQAEALKNPTIEVCGVLIGVDHPSGPVVQQVMWATNVHDDPASSYAIHPLRFLEAEYLAEKLGWVVVGIAHSHLTGPATPSEQDLVTMRSEWCPDWWLWPIYSVRHDEFKMWRLVDGDPAFV